jgi:hypothetical protein
MSYPVSIRRQRIGIRHLARSASRHGDAPKHGAPHRAHARRLHAAEENGKRGKEYGHCMMRKKMFICVVIHRFHTRLLQAAASTTMVDLDELSSHF